MAKRTNKGKPLPEGVVPKQNKFKEEYCNLLIEAGRKGSSLAAFCSAQNISFNTFKNWVNANPSLAEAKRLWRIHAKAYWDMKLEQHMVEFYEGDRLNTSHFKWLQQDRFRATVQFKDTTNLLSCMQDVLEAVNDESINPDDALKFSQLLANMAHLQEHDKLVKDVEELKKIVAQNQSERVGSSESTIEEGDTF